MFRAPNTGQLASRKGSSRDAGHGPPNTGRPVKYGTSGKPIHDCLVFTRKDAEWGVAGKLFLGTKQNQSKIFRRGQKICLFTMFSF